jgi:tetratricopeptide (TPR) repeat protein
MFSKSQKRTVIKTLSISLCLSVLFAASSGAVEYFVGKQGNDANNGQARDKAFLTVQKGVNALKPGDILTIGPGEYFENVKRADLGRSDVDTVIRAEIPGTAILRGDVPAPEFKKVDGYRFVYSAPFDQVPKTVLEHDTLHVMFPKATAAELEFGPGFYHYDTKAKTLYISNPDLSSPEQRRYTVSVKTGHGIELKNPRRVIIEGLAMVGYGAGWGIFLITPDSCVVRDCIALLNEGGINLSPAEGIGGNGGPNNLVEGCVCYGNSYAGIARYGANNDVIRNCRLYRNIREGSEHFGIIHYGSMINPLVMTNNISWGHNFNYSVKPIAKDRLERNVGLGYIRINPKTMVHNLIGGGNEYDRGSSEAPADNILFPREQKLDRDFEFADPLNLDFRLQPDSHYRNSAPDKTDSGPYPYSANIFYVSPSGDDAADGLSMRKPWRTLARAFKGLQPGDTLYMAEGEYAAAPLNKAGNGKTPIRIGVRVRGTAVISGKQTVADGTGIVFERLNFSGGIALRDSRDMAFKNCTFYGTAEGLSAEGVKDLRITHSVFAGVPLDLKKTSGVILSGNIYASSGKTVQLDAASAIRYSDYNNYQDKAQCWQVGGKAWSFAELQKSHERYSQTFKPELEIEKGVPRIKTDNRFKSLGPNSTALGLYHEYETLVQKRDLLGPFLHSANDTTANIEWWSSHPAKYTLAWGETPDMTNKVAGVSGPERFNTYSLSGLTPGKTYYFCVRSVDAFGNSEQEPPAFKPENAQLCFTTAAAASEAKVYYVAPDGSDANSGLGRDKAFLTVNRAATLLKPGDTVMIAGGNYNETVRVRAAGTKERPITFRCIPGERPYFKGENVSLVFQIVSKPDIRLDGLYFDAGFWDKVMIIRQSPRVQITRCLNAMIDADECPEMLVRNCVLRGGWSGLGLGRSPDSLVENNVFIMTILRHISCDSPGTIARNNIFCECIRNKAHQTLLELGEKVKESNNCFYVRWPEDEKLAINNRPLTEYRIRTGSDAIYLNPMMPGTPGWSQGWQQSKVEDFNDCFAANPELIKRGIGLQPEAFRDFKFKVDWAYDVAWADKVMAAEKAAKELVKSGKDAEAMTAYTNLAAVVPMPDRLKSEFLDQAALCANRLKNYAQVMDLAKKIPLFPLSARRQMGFMLEQKKYSELLAAFSEKALGGRNFHQSYTYPELEDTMADLYYYRSIASQETGNLVAAEADLKIMNEKRAQMQYRCGESIHDLVSLRLGDFYRTQLKDETRALEAYNNVIDRTTWSPFGRPPKPASTGGSETLIAATKAASEILAKQGKNDEVKKLKFNLLKAQAEAAAGLLKESDAIAKFKEMLALPGSFTADMEACEKRINGCDAAVREKMLAGTGGVVTGLSGDAKGLLLKAAASSEQETRKTALRTLLMFAPLDKANELLAKTNEESKDKALRAKNEPTLVRMRELEQKKQWKELISEFKDTDLTGWPDDMAREALRFRGTAHLNLKNGNEAEADLKKALDRSTAKSPDPYVFWTLAENYQNNLKDNQKALDAYVKVNELTKGSVGWITFDAVLKASRILRGLGRNSEALKILETAPREKTSGSWRIQLYSAYLETLIALNRKADAVAECNKFLKIQGISAGEKDAIEKKLKELQGNAGQPPKN